MLLYDLLGAVTPYSTAWQLQHELVAARQAESIPDTLILTEHEPVITLGRNADRAGVLASDELLAKMGIAVHRIERGGQATYHGPGQLVGYPIMNLHSRKLGVAEYVRLLEEVMIEAAHALGVEAGRKDGITGLFTAKGKLGAIGVRVSQGVSFHGFAFNRDPDLSHYRLIVPCGMSEIPPTSCAELLGRAPSQEEVKDAVVESFGRLFDVAFQPPSAPPGSPAA